MRSQQEAAYLRNLATNQAIPLHGLAIYRAAPSPSQWRGMAKPGCGSYVRSRGALPSATYLRSIRRDGGSSVNSKLCNSFDEAVADIPDGASIMVAGFSAPGIPHSLVKALYNQGARDLTLIANSGGAGREGMVTMATLIDARRVRKVVFAFTAGTHPSRPVTLQKL